MNKKASKIIGIQFSILSPEEIRNGSVAEITSRETYVNNKPVINGLFDPRMGVLEPGLICPTDGLDYIKTPGYFGHLELARPVFYIQYLNTIIKILRCTCIKCSKLLISASKYSYLLNLNGKERWQKVFSIASKTKRCGEDSENGCGCLQPSKIKREGLATLFAEWKKLDNDSEPVIMKLTPEMVIRLFKRISDDDVNFMGFSSKWSRPEWMVCQVLAIPPPAVRPSIKHDSQQRSEDDISHIIVNIIKTNKTLMEKIMQNAPSNIIDDWTTVLQYFIASKIDNKIPGVASVAQRSGRPLKSIKERLNGKGGRVRGNLMGKRVDFSARSVITPDPNISIRELGVPIKIAKNITKPITVNKMNRKFLTKLVENGPEKYPGAKILEKANGENISLRYIDRESIVLEDGDIVHRHMMDGDAILFNRQPTLHRMSMMCHIVKVMHVGNTFRMNVADTKPYNADFDGDEMNLHMPQDIRAETELRNLAAIQYQIVSPANNKSIIGIFQDSLLGCYQITRKNIQFSKRDAMNILMHYNNIDIKKLFAKDTISSFDILSQIMPPLSLKYKTKHFGDDEDKKDSNNILEINNGNYIRGQMEKGVLGAGSKGLLQRIYNDYGYMASANFIDNLQNIVTEYMKTSAYSVGISDLIANKSTNNKIANIITTKKKEVKNLIDQTHLGIFENKTGTSNKQEFEKQVNNILNVALKDAGKTGKKSLNDNNRFVIMVNAGSKGSDLNISQMISCVGQQNVDGKRIPYGFDDRTLPHFTKFDDTPGARGFVESSYINGLSPEELFFHAVGGRIGIIDTAVKTSQTGYIQRRLIKGLEDLIVKYDMTVRNNKNKIIQFKYGNDNFDTTKVESQTIPIVAMSIEEIYNHFNILYSNKSSDENLFDKIYDSKTFSRMKKEKTQTNTKCKEIIDFMIDIRKEIVEKVFSNKSNKNVRLPIAFHHIINNIKGQFMINENSIVNITPLEVFKMLDVAYSKLESIHYVKPNLLFKAMYYYYLSPKNLLVFKRFNKKAVETLIESIVMYYKKSIISPGEMVGMISAQSIGEPTTQMTLNTFHFAGVASKSNVTRGLPRIEEILSLSENPKNPSCTIYLNKDEETNKELVQNMMYRIEHTKLHELVDTIEICFDPDDSNTNIEKDQLLINKFKEFENLMNECNEETEDDDEKSKWVIRIEINKEMLLDKNISMDDIHFALKNAYDDEINCIYSDYNSDELIFRIRLNNIIKNSKKKSTGYSKINPLDQSDEIYLLKNFQDHLLNKIVLRGIKNIKNVTLRKITDNVVENNDKFESKTIWVIDTVGTNLLDLLGLNYIDNTRTITNDIQEIYKVLGLEAARQSIINEISEVIEFDSTYIDYHHLSVLCDRMTCNLKMISIFRHGINNDNIGPIAKASFEETPEMFLRAARHGELDTMRGVSSNVMCGQEGYFGTNAFKILLNMREMAKRQPTIKPKKKESIDKLLDGDESDDECSKENIVIKNNTDNIKENNDNDVIDDGYDMGF